MNQKAITTLSGLKAGDKAASRTPSICSVSPSGTVQALSNGNCVIDVTRPADATHQAAVRSISISIKSPMISIETIKTAKNQVLVKITAGPEFAKKVVGVWTIARGKVAGKQIRLVKLNAKGVGSFATVKAKYSSLVLKYKGKVIGSMTGK